MSETLSPSRAVAPLFRPQLMIGAATPLWGYFAAAALTGVAMWWGSRWMPAAKPAPLPESVLEPVGEPFAELVAAPRAAEPPQVADAARVVALETPPVAGEAAPEGEATPATAAEPAAEIKLLAAPAAPRTRKAKHADAKAR